MKNVVVLRSSWAFVQIFGPEDNSQQAEAGPSFNDMLRKHLENESPYAVLVDLVYEEEKKRAGKI